MKDGTAKTSTKLVLTECLLRQIGAELEGVGIEYRVTQEFEGSAMELVGSRLGDDVHDAAGGAPRFGSIAVAFDADLLDSIYRRADTDGADHALIVVHAVDHLVGDHFRLTIDGNRGGDTPAVGPGPAVHPVRRSLVGARRKLRQSHIVA